MPFLSFPWKEGMNISHWLVLGPICTELKDISTVIDPERAPFGKYGRGWITNAPLSLHLKQRVFDRLGKQYGIPESVEKELIRTIPSPDSKWNYREVENDWGVDISDFFFVPTFMEAFGFVEIDTDSDAQIEAELIVLGPAAVWIREKKILQTRGPFGYVEPYRVPLQLELEKGLNPLFIRCSMVGWRETRIVMGIRLVEAKNDIRWSIPTGSCSPIEWEETLQALSAVQIQKFSFPEGYIDIRGKNLADLDIQATIALQKEIVSENKIQNRDPIVIGTFLPKQNDVWNWVPSREYYEKRKEYPRYSPLTICFKKKKIDPIQIKREVFLPDPDYRFTSYGEYEERKKEALEVISLQRFDLMGALARIERGETQEIGDPALSVSLDFLRKRKDCADFHALALVVALYRFGTQGKIPTKEAEAIQDTLLSFKYWHDEPGVDAMCWFTENHQIIFHTAAYLAGSLFPSAKFTNAQRTGKELSKLAGNRILRWIGPRFSGGYSEWDSNTYLAMDIYALLALVEYAPSERIQRWAEALLQKTFFMIACHSLQGSHGCSHGRCYVNGLKTSRVESTSGLQRIAWGMGGFDCETWSMGMMALSEKFKLHPLIRRLAIEPLPILETKVHSYGTYHLRTDLREGTWEVDTICRRTQEYLLSAALDLRPGDPGIQEHLWQMTFGPEAVIFTNWPGNGQEHGNARPNFWAGSARLPRVVMEGRCIVCLYDPDFQGGLGYGHAYFPVDVFDEVQFHDEWAFARYGNGYAALRGDSSLRLIEQGRHAGQELRSKNGGRAWLAVAGSKEEDGSFEEFQKSLVSSSVRMEPGFFHGKIPQGKEIQYSWTGPILMEGKEWTPRFSNHYENIFTQMPLHSKAILMEWKGEKAQFSLDLRSKRTRCAITD
jgi:hypothetical protein